MLFANICKYNINADVVCKYLQVKYQCRGCLQIFAITISMQRLFANICKYNINAEVVCKYKYNINADVVCKSFQVQYQCKGCIVYTNICKCFTVSLQMLFANICELSFLTEVVCKYLRVQYNIDADVECKYSCSDCVLVQYARLQFNNRRRGEGGEGRALSNLTPPANN